MSAEARRRIAENRAAHDRGASAYERRHGEIFNPVEQKRLAAKISQAAGLLGDGDGDRIAIDYGAGSGNVTAHLLREGFITIAADVSPRSLEILRQRFSGMGTCRTVLLEDAMLPQIADGSVDLVASYSVLHHIPDYLAALRELARVVRRGGVLYIDHEASPALWTDQPAYREWLSCRNTFAWYSDQLRHLTWNWPLYRLHRLRDPRATEEGDIHVWPDDHINWDAVATTLTACGMIAADIDDYLVYRRHFDESCYERVRMRCSDTRAALFRRPA